MRMTLAPLFELFVPDFKKYLYYELDSKWTRRILCQDFVFNNRRLCQLLFYFSSLIECATFFRLSLLLLISIFYERFKVSGKK